MAAEACGGTLEAALPAACAVEMVHAYSLVHDDLPAMDDDDLRRGRPTCHKVYGEATAILVGDALLARAFEVLATDVEPPSVAAKCCAVLGRAAGATALVGGQADDLAMAERSSSSTAVWRTGSDPPSENGCADCARRWNSAESWPVHTGATGGARSLRPKRWAGVSNHRRSAGCGRQSSGRGQTAGQGCRSRQADFSATVGVEASRRPSGQARGRSVCYDRSIRTKRRAASATWPNLLYARSTRYG